MNTKSVIRFATLFLICFLALQPTAFAALCSVEYEILGFRPDIKTGQIEVQARVCPPLIFGNWVGQSSMIPKLRQQIRNKVNSWINQNPTYKVKLASFSKDHETSMFRSGESGNRCTVISADYTINENTNAINNSDSLLKIGVRDGFPMISTKDGNSWNGAAIIFAKKIATELGRTVEFVELTNIPKCINAVKYGMAHCVISLISKTPERERKIGFSDPYFNTGIGAASLNPQTIAKANKSGFNSSKFTAIVAKGTTAEKLAKNRFKNMHLLVVDKTQDVYTTAKQMEQSTGDEFNGVIMLTDEIIAMTWQDTIIIEHNGRRLYSENQYAVLVKDPAIKKAINQVIRSEYIPEMYTDLVGR